MPDAHTDAAEGFWRERRARHPRLRDALLADARVAVQFRGEGAAPASLGGQVALLARLAWNSDAFLAQALYRVKARAQARGVPVLPGVAHRLAIMVGQVSIGNPVIVAPGVYLPHGQVVLDGITEIGPGTIVAPFVTVGLRAGDFSGPTIGRDVTIGTGAKIIGPVTIGDGATIGANAVVVSDVPAGVTVTGVPARTS